MPAQLSPEQVWIQPDGSVQLIDFLDSPPAVTQSRGEIGQAAASESASSPAGASTVTVLVNQEEQRALVFLGEVARTMLVGASDHQTGAMPAMALAAVSSAEVAGDCRRVVERASQGGHGAAGSRPPCPSEPASCSIGSRGSEFRSPPLRTCEPSSTRRPAGPWRSASSGRGIHLAIQGFFLSVGLALMLVLSSGWLPDRALPARTLIRDRDPRGLGGLGRGYAGRAEPSTGGDRPGTCDGLPAGRPVRGLGPCWSGRCRRPSLPLATILESYPEGLALALALDRTMVVLLGYVAVALLFPSRCLHDRLAGTVLVPSDRRTVAVWLRPRGSGARRDGRISGGRRTVRDQEVALG